MKIEIILSKAILICVLLFTACKSVKNTPTTEEEQPPIPGIELQESWTLTWMKDVAVNNENFIENQYPYFEFYPANDSVVGHSGCNVYFGTITIEQPNSIAFSDMISTRKLCPNVKEEEYKALLQRVNNYQKKENELELRQDTIPLLRFKIQD